MDLPHLRNALSRAPQTDLPEATKEKIIAHLRAEAKKAGIGEDETEKLLVEKAVSIYVPIAKADDEKQIVYGVVLEPETIISKRRTNTAPPLYPRRRFPFRDYHPLGRDRQNPVSARQKGRPSPSPETSLPLARGGRAEWDFKEKPEISNR